MWSAGRSTGNQSMILTREEISFLDVYCHEGTEAPFGGPATDVMTAHRGPERRHPQPSMGVLARSAADWPDHRRTPARSLRRFPGPIVRPSFGATEKSERFARKCDAERVRYVRKPALCLRAVSRSCAGRLLIAFDWSSFHEGHASADSILSCSQPKGWKPYIYASKGAKQVRGEVTHPLRMTFNYVLQLSDVLVEFLEELFERQGKPG